MGVWVGGAARGLGWGAEGVDRIICKALTTFFSQPNAPSCHGPLSLPLPAPLPLPLPFAKPSSVSQNQPWVPNFSLYQFLFWPGGKTHTHWECVQLTFILLLLVPSAFVRAISIMVERLRTISDESRGHKKGERTMTESW